ncbi:MAG: 6-phosphogluconolactonase [Actinomycetes bacterium]
MNVTKILDPSSGVLVSTVVDKTVAAISHNWQQGRPAHVVLTGGRTGTQMAQTLDTEIFRLVTSNEFLHRPELNIWFSDERFTDLSDEARTDSKLIASFSKTVELNQISVHFHRTSSPAQMSLNEAADAYAAELESQLGEKRFDAVLLSMGEDGHIASLFPGLATTAHSTKMAVAVDNSPKPPAERVSISVDRLANSSAIYIFALGEGKREALVNFLTHNVGPVALLQEGATFGQMVIATDLRI